MDAGRSLRILGHVILLEVFAVSACRNHNDSDSQKISVSMNSIVGTWQSGPLVGIITEHEVLFIDDVTVMDYPRGRYELDPIDDQKDFQTGKIFLMDGSAELFSYSISGDSLRLSFQRAAAVQLDRCHHYH